MPSEDDLDKAFQNFWSNEAGKLEDKGPAKELAAKAFMFGFAQRPPIHDLICVTVAALNGAVMTNTETNEIKVVLPLRTQPDLSFSGENVDIQKAYFEALYQLSNEEKFLKTKAAKKLLKKLKKHKEKGGDFNVEETDE